MPFPAKAVANEFLEIANRDGESLSAMKLQKLVYFAHGWYLALTGAPLINEAIEAWQFGPVVPELYREFKRFGSDPVTEAARDALSSASGRTRLPVPRVRDREDQGERDCATDVIEKVWSAYGHYSAIKLSNATHMPGTPWRQLYQEGAHHVLIPNEVIASYFKGIMAHG